MQQVGAKRNPTDKVQPRLALTRLKQARKRLEKVAFAEIVKLMIVLGGIDQVSRAKRRSGHASFGQPGGGSI
jgi:hypothetical protein